MSADRPSLPNEPFRTLSLLVAVIFLVSVVGALILTMWIGALVFAAIAATAYLSFVRLRRR